MYSRWVRKATSLGRLEEPPGQAVDVGVRYAEVAAVGHGYPWFQASASFYLRSGNDPTHRLMLSFV